jgi:endonuclease IV
MNDESKLLDRIRYVILKAPNKFPRDTGMNLEKAFEEMNALVNSIKSQNEFQKCLERAHANYISGDVRSARKALQFVESELAQRQRNDRRGS